MKKTALILAVGLCLGQLANAEMPKPQCPIQEFLFKCAEFKPKNEEECDFNADVMHGIMLGYGVPAENASLLKKVCEAACDYSISSELVAKLFIQEVAPCRSKEGGK